jgi:hypothetical protein
MDITTSIVLFTLLISTTVGFCAGFAAGVATARWTWKAIHAACAAGEDE